MLFCHYFVMRIPGIFVTLIPKIAVLTHASLLNDLARPFPKVSQSLIGTHSNKIMIDSEKKLHTYITDKTVGHEKAFKKKLNFRL